MKYFEKTADMIIGPKDKKGATVVAGGIFVSGNEEDSKRKSAKMMELLKQHGSMNKTTTALKKIYPEAYITQAYKLEKTPKKPKFLFLRPKKKKVYQSAKASYTERSKKPRVFLRTGPAGSASQHFFYNEVARGYYDHELKQPHIPKGKRVIYV